MKNLIRPNPHSPVPGLTVCWFSWNRDHRPGFAAQTILDNKSHVLYELTKRKYETRSKDSLWWNVVANHMNEKTVLRSWIKRRLRGAFVATLATRGFDGNGRVLNGSFSRERKASLKGTLEIFALPPVIKAGFATVQHDTGLIVDEIIRQNERHALTRRGREPVNMRHI